MAVLKCPICGRDAFNSQQYQAAEALAAQDQLAADLVVCHCVQSHRFVVSPKEQDEGQGWQEQKPGGRFAG